jgi:SlyX protein
VAPLRIIWTGTGRQEKISAMDDDTLEQIHLKLAFLERANTELSDVVFRQQQEIQALTARIKEVAERASAGHGGGEERSAEDERPPHY